MNISEETKKLTDKIISSEAIFVYSPSMYVKHFYKGAIPVRIYADCFAKLLENRFAYSIRGGETYKGSATSIKIPRVLTIGHGELLPPLNGYKNFSENLLLAIDMGDLERRFLKPLMSIVDKFSRCAVTSDTEFYEKKEFDVIQVEDEAGLRHVLFGATDLLKEKLPPLISIPITQT